MCPGTGQRWWESIWCCLHTEGSYHWTVLRWHRHTLKVCFSFWQLNGSFHFDPVMKCWSQHIESPKPQHGKKSLLNFICLLPLPPIWWFIYPVEMDNPQVPSLWPHIGRRFPDYPLVAPPRRECPTPIPHGPWECLTKAGNGRNLVGGST